MGRLARIATRVILTMNRQLPEASNCGTPVFVLRCGGIFVILLGILKWVPTRYADQGPTEDLQTQAAVDPF